MAHIIEAFVIHDIIPVAFSWFQIWMRLCSGWRVESCIFSIYQKTWRNAGWGESHLNQIKYFLCKYLSISACLAFIPDIEVDMFSVFILLGQIVVKLYEKLFKMYMGLIADRMESYANPQFGFWIFYFIFFFVASFIYYYCYGDLRCLFISYMLNFLNLISLQEFIFISQQRICHQKPENFG